MIEVEKSKVIEHSNNHNGNYSFKAVTNKKNR